MVNFKNLKIGEVLSESQFYTVVKTKNDQVQLQTVQGEHIVVNSDYVEQFLSSGDQFDSTEKIAKTEMAEKFKEHSRTAVTVAFYKADKKKTNKAYDKEVQDAIDSVQNARMSEAEALLKAIVTNPISRIIPGELRVMKGYHFGELNDLGRITFIDMEETSEHKTKQVDPRSIQYFITGGVKYQLK